MQNSVKYLMDIDVLSSDELIEYRSRIKDELGDNKKILSSLHTSIKKYKNSLSISDYQKMKDGMEQIYVLYANSSTDEECKSSCVWLVDNWKIDTNGSRKKAYVRAIPNTYRRIISGTSGTIASANLIERVSEYVDLSITNHVAISQKITTAAKPDLGVSYLPKKYIQVKQLFEQHPILSRINESHHGIYGVSDGNGRIKMPSSDYSREYLEQSINNPAMDRTIEVISEFVKSEDVDYQVVDLLQQHQERLRTIVMNYDIPSTIARDAIGHSYNTLMVSLYNIDDSITSAIMKQFAENRLYEENLAIGNEVYLPCHGSFPAGDVIKLNYLETVSLVSCKYGVTSTRVYGFPANAKSITSLHNDELKRNNQGQYLGEIGNTLLISDKLIRGDNTRETSKKMKKFIKVKLKEIKLKNLFGIHLNKIVKLSTEYMYFIDSIHLTLDTSLTASVYWDEFNIRLAEREIDFNLRMGKLITSEHISALAGPNNVKKLMGIQGKMSPATILSLIDLANNIITSDGYGLDHNKQYFNKDNQPQMITSKGTNNPDDYSIQHRIKRTSGRNGGGLLLSFSGDGNKRPIYKERTLFYKYLESSGIFRIFV